MDENDGETPRQAAEDLWQSYDLLIRTLRWERDRYIQLAEQIAAETGKEGAKRMLLAQAKYIRRQAIR